jgi:hypothetical protein
VLRGDHANLRRDLIAHGDAYLATLRDFTPADGTLSEQINRDTGA